MLIVLNVIVASLSLTLLQIKTSRVQTLPASSGLSRKMISFGHFQVS